MSVSHPGRRDSRHDVVVVDPAGMVEFYKVYELLIANPRTPVGEQPLGVEGISDRKQRPAQMVAMAPPKDDQ